MNKPDDVEALLAAVRSLVSSRPFDDPLVLTSAQRVTPALQPEATADGDGYKLPQGDAVLRDFARLTLIAPAEPEPQETDPLEALPPEPDLSEPSEDPDGHEAAMTAEEAEAAIPEPAPQHPPVEDADLTALRALIREVLRDEVRTRMGRRINDNIRRIVREELQRHFSTQNGPG